MGIFDIFKRKPSNTLKGYTSQSMEGVIFYDSFGRVVGNGLEGFKYLNSLNKKPTFYEITNKGFGQSPWVYIIVDRIAKACMQIPISLLDLNNQPLSSNARRMQRVRDLERLMFNPQPNFNGYSLKKLVYSCTSNYLLTGNGYMVGFPNNTEEQVPYTNLIVPLSQNVDPNDNGDAKLTFYNVNYYSMYFNPPPKDVMQVALPNLTRDIFEGHSSMQSLSNIWRANNALNANEQYIHERKGSSGVMYSEASVPLTPDERKKMQEEIDKDVNGRDRVGRYTYFPQKVGYIDLAKSFKDLQGDKSRNAQRETIAAAYNYPVQLLNDTTSSAYNNVKELDKTAFVKAVLPVMDFFLKELNEWLVRGSYSLETVKIGYNVDDIPEMNLINADKTDNNQKKLKMVLEVNESVANGNMSVEVGINTLVMAGGFSEDDAAMLVSNQNRQQQ